jgi:transcription elongation factor Elf1
MGDRYIYICPNCNDEIYVGGGINEQTDGNIGFIKCSSCKKIFKIEIKLIEINHIETNDLTCDKNLLIAIERLVKKYEEKSLHRVYIAILFGYIGEHYILEDNKFVLKN